MHYLSALKNFRPLCEQETRDKALMLEKALIDPQAILYRASALYHMTASSMIVDPSRTRVLMAFHNIYQSWAWTGGHADGEDDLFAVARREAGEETGISRLTPLTEAPISLEILTVQPHIKRGKLVCAHLHFNLTYAFIGDDQQPLVSKPDENAKVGWLPIDKLEEYVSEPEMVPVYRKILSRMV